MPPGRKIVLFLTGFRKLYIVRLSVTFFESEELNMKPVGMSLPEKPSF